MKQQKYTAFGRLLRQARTDLTMTQSEVADAVGICADWYARIESGEARCSLKTLAALRRTLQADANALLEALDQHSKPVEGTAPPGAEEPEHTSGRYDSFSRAFLGPPASPAEI